MDEGGRVVVELKRKKQIEGLTEEDCREKVIRREQRDGRRKEKVRLGEHEGG